MSDNERPEDLPARPHPEYNEISEGYWAGAQLGKLTIQQCGDCGTYIHFPMALCPKCQSEALGFSEVSGAGTIYSFAVIHQNFHPAFTPPYVIGLIDLDDAPGVRLYTNIIDCDAEDLSIGMSVQARFEDIGDGTLIPQFAPA